MPVPIKIPKLGMSMSEAMLVGWLVAEGDRVEESQAIAEIETEKIVNEIASPAGGTLAGCSVSEGDVAAVAQTIGWVLVDGESLDDIPANGGQVEAEPFVPGPTEAVASASNNRESSSFAPCEQPPAKARRALCSPAVRRLARERGVDLSTIVGSAADGRIVKEDVLRAARKPAPSAAEDEFERFSATRRAIADTVTRSAAIPQIVLRTSADVSALLALHNRDKSIAYGDMFAYHVAKTLQGHKYLNASYEDEGIRFHAQVNIGLAVTVKKRLLIPVIRGADSLSLRQISDERKRLMELVRSRKITEQDISCGTFTISNLSMYPVDSFTALLNPPQVAILSVGRMQNIATPTDDGGSVFRPMMTLGLTLDHRVVDGAAGAVFLRHLIARIERPNLE